MSNRDYVKTQIRAVLAEMPLDGDYLDDKEMDLEVEEALRDIMTIIDDYKYKETQDEDEC